MKQESEEPKGSFIITIVGDGDVITTDYVGISSEGVLNQFRRGLDEFTEILEEEKGEKERERSKYHVPVYFIVEGDSEVEANETIRNLLATVREELKKAGVVYREVDIEETNKVG